MEINNVTKYIENKLSIERHKINLLEIYNRKSLQDMNKENVFVNRVLNNKKISRIRVKEEENYYINIQNELITRKLNSISKRPNVR